MVGCSSENGRSVFGWFRRAWCREKAVSSASHGGRKFTGFPAPARSGFLPRFSANRGFERRAARENTARLELLRASCLGDTPSGLLLHAAHCRGASRVAGERLLLLGSVLPAKTNLL